MTDIPAPFSVMLIDDDRFLLDMYAKKFGDEGYAVHAFPSVREALEALRGGVAPDAIVFDLTMPQEDGFDLLRALRDEALAPSARKIVLTNQSSEEEESRTKELGADAFIVKATLIPSEVFGTIDTMLRTRR